MNIGDNEDYNDYNLPVLLEISKQNYDRARRAEVKLEKQRIEAEAKIEALEARLAASLAVSESVGHFEQGDINEAVREAVNLLEADAIGPDVLGSVIAVVLSEYPSFYGPCEAVRTYLKDCAKDVEDGSMTEDEFNRVKAELDEKIAVKLTAIRGG